MKQTGKDGDLAYRILKSPVISEKSTELTGMGKYVFKVNTHSNKSEVKKAIERFYGVKVMKVNIMNFSGKEVTRGGRFRGKRPDFKKVIVTLQEGEKIDMTI